VVLTAEPLAPEAVAAWVGPVIDRLRLAIEHETNQRAAAPYAALNPGDRLELLAGLGALPG
jgi:hypothetical protein